MVLNRDLFELSWTTFGVGKHQARSESVESHLRPYSRALDALYCVGLCAERTFHVSTFFHNVTREGEP